MNDNNNLVVYCEFDDGRIADVSLELLTKGRTLATRLGVKLEALVLGDKLDGIEGQLFPYGVDVVYKVEDERLYPYTSLPHSSIVINLFKEIKPQICLMGATWDHAFRRASPAVLLPTAPRWRLATTSTPSARPSIRTCSIRFVLPSAATLWQPLSIPSTVLKWPPCARA